MTHPTGLGEYTTEELKQELASREQFLGDFSMEVGGQHFVDHVKVAIKNECRYRGIPMLDDMQIGVVITSLRNHSYTMLMTHYDRRKLGRSDEVSDFYPIESSVGRFLRDAGYVLIDRAEAAKSVSDDEINLQNGGSADNAHITIKEVLSLVDTTKTPDNPDGNPFVPGNLSIAEALATIKQLVLDEVIGENPSKMSTDNLKYDRRVAERLNKQRQALEKVMGGKELNTG